MSAPQTWSESRQTSGTTSPSTPPRDSHRTHGIRIVPYTPPRLSESSAAGRTESHSSEAASWSLQQHSISPAFANEGESSGTNRNGEEGGAASPRWSSVDPLAEAKRGQVSGTKPAAPSDSTPGTTARPLGATNFAALNAPAQSQLQPPPRQSSRRHLLAVPAAAASAAAGEQAAGSAAASKEEGRGQDAGPRSRRRNFVAIHSDKTFTLVPLAKTGFFENRNNSNTQPPERVNSNININSRRGLTSDPGSSLGSRSTVTSPPLSLSTARTSAGSHEGLSDAFLSDAFADDRPSSPASSAGTIPDRTHKSFPHAPASPIVQLAEPPVAGNPQSTTSWNYRMVGGLRKVPTTPDQKKKSGKPTTRDERESSLSPLLDRASAVATASPSSPSPSSPPSSPALSLPSPSPYPPADDDGPPRQSHPPPAPPPPPPPPPHSLVTKQSFASDQTGSEDANYEVYGQSSPIHQSSDSLSLRPSNSSNVQLIGDPSPAPSRFDSSPSRPQGSSGSEDNYIIHGEPSPSTAVNPRPKFSQESLVVPPLQPTRKRSHEKFGYYKQRSRENLRRPNSAKSTQSTSSAAGPSDPSRNLFLGFSFINDTNQPAKAEGSSRNPLRLQPDSWAGSPPGAFGFGNSKTQSPTFPMVEPHPHQWSSQLSTVMSEEEEESSRGGSRTRSRSTMRFGGSVSGSGNGSGDARRDSSGWASSTHSRQVLSISSSLAAQLEDSRSLSRSQSNTDSLERPAPAYGRGNGYYGDRTVRDLDEDGEGITDLRQLSNHPSRSGLSGFMSSSDSSRNLHSSASSRSFNSSTLPVWARVYYGSGERRRLSAPSISEMSEGSRPGSAMRTDPGSPNTDHFPINIWSPRRRVQETRPPANRQLFSDSASMEIEHAQPVEDWHIRPGLRKITSSIWSPHLRYDQRASRYNRWDPPSVSWSADSGVWGRRNAQVTLFVLGFIFPFAWMIAALLPIPVKPQLPMMQRDNSQSELGIPDSLRRQPTSSEDIRYQSARWWRTLNRCMSVVGLIIVGVVIGLVVVGVQQGWYQRP